MNAIRKPWEQGFSNHFGFLNSASAARWAPIPLRLMVGYGFMQHGFAKLARGPEAFAVILDGFGVPAPHITAWIMIAVEIVGGCALLLALSYHWSASPCLGF